MTDLPSVPTFASLYARAAALGIADQQLARAIGRSPWTIWRAKSGEGHLRERHLRILDRYLSQREAAMRAYLDRLAARGASPELQPDKGSVHA